MLITLTENQEFSFLQGASTEVQLEAKQHKDSRFVKVRNSEFVNKLGITSEETKRLDDDYEWCLCPREYTVVKEQDNVNHTN